MGLISDFIKRYKEKHAKEREWHKEFHREQFELRKRFIERHKSSAELKKYHRHIKSAPFIFLAINLLIWYLIFRYAGIKVFSVFFALLISIGGILQLFFLLNIEKRILKPLDKLKNGVEEIAKGNYDVKVELSNLNEISLLIDSFNEMALKLKESEKMQLEYEENRKTLIANISHDLKTPITSIQGYVEAITEGNAISHNNLNKYLRIIYNNSAYINKLVDDLFLFSKLDMQKLEFQFVEVNASPFFDDLMEEFKIELDEKQINFNYKDKLIKECIVNVDRKRMHQVLGNIIGNAIKYGPEKGLSINATLYIQDGFVCTDIKDNGQGIPEDKLTNIFKRFYRVDTERTKDLSSTGLGLAIAKELVEAHGGRIEVTSIEGEGTCFTILLPQV